MALLNKSPYLNISKEKALSLIDDQKKDCSLSFFPTFSNDFEVVFSCVKRNPQDLVYASVELKDNFEIVDVVVSKDSHCLTYAGFLMKNNFDIVHKAVGLNGLTLNFASFQLKNNYHIALRAVTQNGLALQYVSGHLQNNKKIVLTASHNVSSAEFYHTIWRNMSPSLQLLIKHCGEQINLSHYQAACYLSEQLDSQIQGIKIRKNMPMQHSKTLLKKML